MPRNERNDPGSPLRRRVAAAVAAMLCHGSAGDSEAWGEVAPAEAELVAAIAAAMRVGQKRRRQQAHPGRL
jgi:hypothetical protein